MPKEDAIPLMIGFMSVCCSLSSDLDVSQGHIKYTLSHRTSMSHRNAVSEKLYCPTKVLATSIFDFSHAFGFMLVVVLLFQVKIFVCYIIMKALMYT